MKVLAISSAVRGFHVYKDIWKPSISDKLACEREFDNCFDKSAIKDFKLLTMEKQWAIYHASSRR